MRIGVITTSYPRYAGDPAGNFVAAHVATLRGLGHHVEVIAAGDRRRRVAEAPRWIPQRETSAREVSVTRIASPLFYDGGAPDALERATSSVLHASVFAARLAYAITRRARRWDSIVAHWLAPSALAALPTRARLLAIAHGGDVHLLRRTGLLAPALYALRARNARLAFVSRDLLELARAAAPRLTPWLDAAAIVQPMGIDVTRFAALPRRPQAPPMILVAARLVPIKGVDVALDALGHLQTPARLVIAGDGPLRGALTSRRTTGTISTGAGSLPNHSIELLGNVDTVIRDQLLTEASVVIVPSRVLPNGRTEGMPMIALEAIAAGVPVVASNVGGLRELAPHLVLVPPDDPRALAVAIDRALALPASLPPAISVLDWSVVAARLLAHAGA